MNVCPMLALIPTGGLFACIATLSTVPDQRCKNLILTACTAFFSQLIHILLLGVELQKGISERITALADTIFGLGWST